MRHGLLSTIARAASLGALVALYCCGGGDFDPQNKVTSVRVLAVRMDMPYAGPGDTVTVDVLAVDGRIKKQRPMRISWIPLLCTNPRSDLYYDCFRSFAASVVPAAPVSTGDAGAPSPGRGSSGAELPIGVNLAPLLPSGPTFTTTLPTNIIRSHPDVPGAVEPYGLGIVFFIACAGEVRILPRDPSNASPQQVPIACTDEAGTPLGPEEYVFAFSRIYAFDKTRNQNPQIDGLVFQGAAVDPVAGITVDHCTSEKEQDCPKLPIDVTVPPSSQEEKPIEGSRERIWATYYATAGRFSSDARLLYDSKTGRGPKPEDEYQPPLDPGEGRLFVVVHDDRDGANWLEVPVHVR